MNNKILKNALKEFNKEYKVFRWVIFLLVFTVVLRIISWNVQQWFNGANFLFNLIINLITSTFISFIFFFVISYHPLYIIKKVVKEEIDYNISRICLILSFRLCRNTIDYLFEIYEIYKKEITICDLFFHFNRIIFYKMVYLYLKSKFLRDVIELALFSLQNNGKLQEISEMEFKLERELQKVCEENLENLLGLKFVKSEFSIENYRFDTLAYDEETKSFVIIEYKRGQNYSVVDQGYAYLATMLNNKAEFILEFNESFDETLKRSDIDWSQSKIIFISQNFTKFQKDTINFKDLPIELYEIRKFDSDIISFNEIKGKRISSSIKNLSIESETVKQVTTEIKKYTLEDCLNTGSEETIELFEEFSNRIEEMLPDIKIEPKKLYVAFRKNKKNIIDFRLQKSQIKMWINVKKGELQDSKNIFRDVSETGHWGNGDYELTINDNEELEYILSLIKQVYKYY